MVKMKETSHYTVEICVMGVKKEYHRLGIGSKLFEAFYQVAKEKGYEFIQVKTVREGIYPDYDFLIISFSHRSVLFPFFVITYN